MSKHSPPIACCRSSLPSARRPKPCLAKELSLTLEQPLSSTYRHLKTLLRWGLAEEQAGQGRYLPGPACLQLAKKFDREASLIGLAKPELKRLADLSQESVALMVASNQQAICLNCSTVRSRRAAATRKGWRSRCCMAPRPSPAGAPGGRTARGAVPRPGTLRRAYRQAGAGTPADPRTGYAVSQGEIDEGVWGISVPLLDSRQRLHGAPQPDGSRLARPVAQRTLAAMDLDAAARLSARLD